MSEPKVNEKKVVGRDIAIALGIICIVVVAGLVGAFAYYVNDKNKTISSLNTQYYQLYSNFRNLTDQVNDLNDILNFGKYEFWTNGWITVNQPAGSYSSWNHSVPYAGAISVWVTPLINGTWFRVLWYYRWSDIQYDNQTYGIQEPESDLQGAAFPVLPTSNVEIRVGNTVSAGEVQFTVIIEYEY